MEKKINYFIFNVPSYTSNISIPTPPPPPPKKKQPRIMDLWGEELVKSQNLFELQWSSRYLLRYLSMTAV